MKFNLELAVERPFGSGLPRFTGFDERRVDILLGKLGQYRVRDVLRSMIRSQFLRSTVNADQFGEHLDDAIRAKTLQNVDSEALSGVLIDHRQTLQLLPIGASVKHEVVRPDPVVGRGRFFDISSPSADQIRYAPGRRRSSGSCVAPERTICGDNRNGDIGPTAHASPT